jgi:tripartite-type tricarboxylate transporter receptor subunit TctC
MQAPRVVPDFLRSLSILRWLPFVALLLGTQSAVAAWPDRPLTIIVPFAAGGTSDIIARLLTKPLSDALGQPVIVDNKTGANGNVGASVVANSNDEYKILLTDVSSLAISPLVTPDLPFKPEQLKGLTMLAFSPHLLAVPASFPVSNIAELVAASKKQPINVASSGSGSVNHLGIVEIALSTGMQWVHVPYKGGAASVADTVAGVTQLVLNGKLATLPQVTGGKLKAIGISSPKRDPSLPNVPTIAEQGVKGYESGTYQGVAVPATMSAPVVQRLHAELTKIVNTPEMKKRLADAGADVMTMSPADTDAFIVRERKRWGDVIQRAGKQLEGSNK